MRIVGGGARRHALSAGAVALTIWILAGAFPAAGATIATCVDQAPAWSAAAAPSGIRCAAATIAAVVVDPRLPQASSVGGVYTVPPTIDPTGVTEVSSALSAWFASIPPATSEQPITIRFQPGATYWCDYTLLLRKVERSSGGISGNMWRTLPGYDLSNTTIDLNGSTIVQRTTTPWRYGNAPVLDPRKRWGDPILFTAGASNVRITNGTLVGSANPVRYDPDRESWMGILMGGDNEDDLAQNMRVDHMAIKNVWGDFIYMASQTARGKLLRDVTIEDNLMRGAGRHGMTIQSGTHVTIRRNEIRNACRMTFDSEPAAAHGWQDVSISENTVGVSSLGFFQYQGQRTSPAGGLSITNNTVVNGHMTIEISNGSDTLRQGVTITGNRSLDPTEFRRSTLHRNLVTVNRWSGVTVADNQDRVHVNSQPFAVDASTSPGAAVRNNAWAGSAVAALR